MASKSKEMEGRVPLFVSTAQRPEFKHPLAIFAFDARGELIHRANIADGKVELPLSPRAMYKARVFVAPVDEKTQGKLTLAQLQRLGAYEPVLHVGDRLVDRIDIPGTIIDFWPFCFCWVRGKVIRNSDNRVVCNARVHICEVDRIPIWIGTLVDSNIFKLRDDLLEVLRNPPIPGPGPGPEPFPERLPGRFPGPVPGPGPDPRFAKRSLARSAMRFAKDAGSLVSLNPQPLPPVEIGLAPELHAMLRSTSAFVVRNALVANWKLLLPWFCHWPHWWYLFRCDEIATITTDPHGRFETVIWYPCKGDHPDLYFWVEYDFGSGFETIYRPRVPCYTWWDYACGSEVIIRITDPRVPGCDEEPDLPGCQVVVMSIGNGVAVREVQTAGDIGLTNSGEPFGGTLEPRVDFSRTELIDVQHIPYYRWSYTRLTEPDGVTPVVGATPSVMTRDVYRHYKVGTSFPSDPMGPLTGALANLFRIRPLLPPAGPEWVVVNEHIDLATAYFETASLPGSPPSGAPLSEDLAAGLYEMKLELFDAGGALVDWTARGVDLRITGVDAPFGTGTIPTVAAPPHNRILNPAGHTMGFKMVIRVDNNRCYSEVLPITGTVTSDPACGFYNYDDTTDQVGVSFIARHPNHFATYTFDTARGLGSPIGAASTSGTAGEPNGDGFAGPGTNFMYAKDVAVSVLLGGCPNAAFSESVYVRAMATDGYSRLSGYDHSDLAAFALAKPCPTCEECEEDA